MKKVISLLLIVLMFSCKDEGLNSCRFIEIELTVINETAVDVLIETVVLGCRKEANDFSGDLRAGLVVNAGETYTYTPGISGASKLLISLFIVGDRIGDQISSSILKENQKFTVLITFDGTDYKKEFIESD